ncbi:MAG: ABC transporter substrate-binding protein [Gammaproteobacteria bacterium]|nr:ABC transporter substrate-binding protein [Gammaproteobacteria bacterium]NIR83032.1 ABC transporter substrate-binding protein [Gammaproteobacteria bacterium]NIU04185.1 ABC transporter substrate-binding protein [Gammaproteobacteria bacterium]NIX85459.1 hypothetical protein [Gammaproteobacteria bacterium]
MRHVIAALSTLVCVSAIPAQVTGPAPQAPRPLEAPNAPRAQLEPEQVVRRGLDRLSGFLRGADNPGPEHIRAFLDEEIAPNFDFAAMARWAGGPLYHRLTQPQRAQLTERLRELFLSALARNLGAYAEPSPRIEVYPSRRPPWVDQTTVRAVVIPQEGLPILLDFRFYRTARGWKIFDVAANGASAAAYYRNYFGNLLRRYGPDALG